MFGSGSSTGHDNSGVSPVRFVWPYGGGEVSIFGTFTRWTDLIPMSPMEGCPNVYQVVVSLVPGLHQFKFYVDGQWRVDEQLSFVSGPYGLVNTVVLTKDPPQIIDSETPGRSNMELDDVSVCPTRFDSEVPVCHIWVLPWGNVNVSVGRPKRREQMNHLK